MYYYLHKFVVFSDEKEKYDPNTFRDAILQGLTEAGTDLDQASTPVTFSQILTKTLPCIRYDTSALQCCGNRCGRAVLATF